MFVPETVTAAIKKINRAGFLAYIVGGAVRDALLGLAVKDFDICTNAKPEEIISIFEGEKIVDTGIRFGSVRICFSDMSLEVTTFRSDGSYTDRRRPASVDLDVSLKEDLARRDFTVNAIAYHPNTGTIDPFFGTKDLSLKILRAVGNPEQRFLEDALRILRALRLSATHGFAIERETEKAMLLHKEGILLLSSERVRDEFSRLILADGAGSQMLMHSEIWYMVFPEIKRADSLSPGGGCSWLSDTAKVIDITKPRLLNRLAALFSEISKPGAADEVSEEHIAADSAKTTEQILTRLRFSKILIKDVTAVIRNQAFVYDGSNETAARALGLFGEELTDVFIENRRARLMAGRLSDCHVRLEALFAFEQGVKKFLAGGGCYSIARLAVGGDDLLARGLCGKELGGMLERMLKAVITGESENDKDELLKLILE